jgi:hypothetical protein
VVTRRDLPVSYQAVQAAHAAIDFQHQYPTLADKWHCTSNYLIFLSVANEDEFKQLILKAAQRQIKISAFREPDINDELTAIAFEPCEQSRKITSSCPLMGKEVYHA